MRHRLRMGRRQHEECIHWYPSIQAWNQEDTVMDTVITARDRGQQGVCHGEDAGTHDGQGRRQTAMATRKSAILTLASTECEVLSAKPKKPCHLHPGRHDGFVNARVLHCVGVLPRSAE